MICRMTINRVLLQWRTLLFNGCGGIYGGVKAKELKVPKRKAQGDHPATTQITKCLSAVFAAALDWLFEEVGKGRRSASRTCCRSVANGTPRHGRDSRLHCDERAENDSGRAAPGGFSCFAESDGTSSPHAIVCDSLTTASIGHHRLSRAQFFHSTQLPVAAKSAGAVVVAPGRSTAPQLRAPSEHQQFAILPDPARLRSARHQTALPETRSRKTQMPTPPTNHRR